MQNLFIIDDEMEFGGNCSVNFKFALNSFECCQTVEEMFIKNPEKKFGGGQWTVRGAYFEALSRYAHGCGQFFV